MFIEAGAKPVNKGNYTGVQGSPCPHFPHQGCGSAEFRDDPQENAHHHVEHHPVALHEVAQPLRYRQHPLGQLLSRCLLIAWRTKGFGVS